MITVTTRPDAVAVLTFDQPGSKANVLTRELWTAFGDALTALAPRTDLKGLVLASAKPGIFIAGADLKLLANAPAPNDPDVRAFIEQGLRVLEQLEALPFPTCAAIDGAALGGGLEVALACDLQIVTINPKVRIGLPEVTLGLIPGWGGTQRLTRCMTRVDQAAEMLTTGRTLTAVEAISDYLWTHGAPPEPSPQDSIERFATSVNRTPLPLASYRRRLHTTRQVAFTPPPGLTGAAAEAVRVMVEGAALPLYDAIKLETEAFMRLAGSDESKRLIAEFFASRKK